MKYFMICICILSINVHASFMDKVGDFVESTLSDDDEKSLVSKIKTVGTTKTVANGSPKESTVDKVMDKVDETVDDTIDDMKKIIGIKKDKPKKKSSVGRKIETAFKEVAGLKKVKEDNRIFDGGIMGKMADMIDLEKGESMGLPSVFGLNKKKRQKVFGSTILGDTLLGDAKDTTTSFYRGFKNTGESTEFMSGMMYKSSKMYNGMFDMFDDSVFNIFDDKDKREPSIFDMVDEGNSILEMFD